MIEIELMEHASSGTNPLVNPDFIVTVEPFNYLSEGKEWEGSRITLDNGRIIETPTSVDDIKVQLTGLPLE